MFMPDEDRYTYAEGRSRGGYLVSASVSAPQYERALDILDDEGTINIDERAASWRSDGWQGYQGGSTSAASARGGSGSSQTGAGLPTYGHGATSRLANEEVIPVTEERLRVGKREESHGRVRVRSYVVETPVQEQVNLRDEHVHVERRPVDRPLNASEASFKDRTIEATETAERAVVGKDARVVEEVVVRKDESTRKETINDTVRKTQVEVEDERVDGGAARTPRRS